MLRRLGRRRPWGGSHGLHEAAPARCRRRRARCRGIALPSCAIMAPTPLPRSRTRSAGRICTSPRQNSRQVAPDTQVAPPRENLSSRGYTHASIERPVDGCARKEGVPCKPVRQKSADSGRTTSVGRHQRVLGDTPPAPSRIDHGIGIRSRGETLSRPVVRPHLAAGLVPPVAHPHARGRGRRRARRFRTADRSVQVAGPSTRRITEAACSMSRRTTRPRRSSRRHTPGR